MNFLSHYYFDRETSNCYHILGTILPDLLKNADKSIIIHPEKLNHPDPDVQSIIIGWQKHLDVDRYFHSSAFFVTHSHELKKLLATAIEGSPVKPFFLGHIAIELILDNLLLTTGKISVEDFYNHLESCNENKIREFLIFAGLKNPEIFMKFFGDFKNNRYLHTYADTMKIAYALKRICMRVWNDPFLPHHEQKMNEILTSYRLKINGDYMQIFNEIEPRLN